MAVVVNRHFENHKLDPFVKTRLLSFFLTPLPASEYEVDSRAHFAVMGEKYKKEAADLEKEIWIPIMEK